jgi:hypothetical protein
MIFCIPSSECDGSVCSTAVDEVAVDIGLTESFKASIGMSLIVAHRSSSLLYPTESIAGHCGILTSSAMFENGLVGLGVTWVRGSELKAKAGGGG